MSLPGIRTRAPSRLQLGIALLGLVLGATFAACGGSDGSTAASSAADGGAEGGGGCTPGAKECVTDGLARVCPADGSGWLALACGNGTTCKDGACSLGAAAQCTPGAGSCADPSTALHCRADGSGLEQAKCPTGTTCAGPGLCVGACVVGESICMAPGVVATCVDGTGYQQTACNVGELCVATGQAPVKAAACKPAECVPDPQGCDFVCGNRTNPAADQTKYMSSCQATPNGYKWVAVQCAGSQSCDPNGGTCNRGRDTMAACQNACTPGSQRCSPDGLGYQTCDATGSWSTMVTTCNPTPTAAALRCMPQPGTPGKVVCGDPLCAAGYAGTCDATGNIRLCGNDGKIAATATACQAGICRAVSNNAIGGAIPGACQTQCQAGDTRCIAQGSTSYLTCTNTGTWSTTPVTCASNSTCFGWVDANGGQQTLCGAVCVPGTHKCNGDQIQTCDVTGQWAAAAACSFGVCTTVSNGKDAACLGQCVPGSTVCRGSVNTIPGLDPNWAKGYSASGTCTAQGTWPASPTSCTSGQFCRISSTGVATGCLECVGSNIAGGNEIGFVDSKCVNSNTQTESCQANDTWGSPASCPSNTSCTTVANVPKYTCGDCFGTKCANSDLIADTGSGCAAHGMSIQSCGGTLDCCSGACQPNGFTQKPAPATCQ